MNTFNEEKLTFESWFCYFYLYLALRHAPLETTGSYTESEQFLNSKRINQTDIELGRKSTEIQFFIFTFQTNKQVKKLSAAIWLLYQHDVEITNSSLMHVADIMCDASIMQITNVAK